MNSYAAALGSLEARAIMALDALARGDIARAAEHLSEGLNQSDLAAHGGTDKTGWAKDARRIAAELASDAA